jgi:C4-dicarboxylate-binding protein DctP
MKKRGLAVIVMFLVIAFCLSACGNAATGAGSAAKSSGAAAADDGKVYNLQWAHSSSAGGDRLSRASTEIIDEIKKASNGRLVFTQYPASQLGAETEELQGVTLGTVDLAVISTGPVASFFPQIECTSIPYMINQREVGWAVYDSDFGKTLGKLSESAGWKWLGWAENGLRIVSNSKREIKTPADMKGLKIRTMENKIHMAIINDLGASATPIAFNELYTALQQGTVDGQENGAALTYSMGFYEQLKYMTMLPHVYDPYIVVMSNKAWDSLPPDLQELLQEYIDKFCDLERQYNANDDKDYLQKMEDAGLQVYTPTDAEAQQFIDKTSTVVDTIRKDVGDDLVDQYISAVNTAKQNVPTASSSASSSASK